MTRLFSVSLLLILVMTPPVAGASASAAPSSLQRIPRPGLPGRAASVRAPDTALVFTGLIHAGNLAAPAREQAERALDATAAAVAAAGGDWERVLRVNAYVSEDRAVPDVEAAVAARFASVPVACTVVRTPLESPGARVAFEAVAASASTAAKVAIVDRGGAVLPAGGKIFISGQAERGTDVASAVKLTMAGLHRSLAHLGLEKSDVAQVKAFIQPFADHAAARREIAASFDGGPVPPVVLIEWVSELYAEIELVASARALPAPAGDVISHAWLPWLTRSPRYCHIAHVAAGTPLIFVGAVDGGDANDPRTQMKAIFERLGSVLFEAGSSYRNLAKATYFLADPTARGLLGDIRGVYFDPTRPPAASALNQKGTGFPGRAAMVDLIAVPVK